jgi:hypothetical protein
LQENSRGFVLVLPGKVLDELRELVKDEDDRLRVTTTLLLVKAYAAPSRSRLGYGS